MIVMYVSIGNLYNVIWGINNYGKIETDWQTNILILTITDHNNSPVVVLVEASAYKTADYAVAAQLL